MSTMSRGFTITELLVAMLVSLVVSLAGWGFYRTQLRVLTDQAAELDAAESARAALGFMAREIRQAGFDPADTAFPDPAIPPPPAVPPLPNPGAISNAQAELLAFQLDNDSSGAVDPGAVDPLPEIVAYSYDAANERILRSVNGASQSLIRNVPAGGLLFQYFDRNGTAIPLGGPPAALTTAQRDNVAFVRLRIRVQAETTGSPTTVELSAQAALRNRILERL